MDCNGLDLWVPVEYVGNTKMEQDGLKMDCDGLGSCRVCLQGPWQGWHYPQQPPQFHPVDWNGLGWIGIGRYG